MKVEEIAIRQEIRQMLTEACINRNTLKDMVKTVLQEELEKACKQALNETDVDQAIARKLDNHFRAMVRDAVKESISSRVNGIFNRMTVSVDITDETGTSVTTR